MNDVKTFAILLVLVLIVRVVAFFAGSETAYLSITKIKMRQLVREKKKNARTAAKLKENIDELLTIILIGTNFMNTLASALATSLAVKITGSSGVGIATAMITFFVTIFGQIVPKTAASIRTERTVLKNAIPLLILEKIFFPIVWLFSRLTKATARVAGKIWKFDNVLVTEEELMTLFDVGTKEGTLEAGESKMLKKIFKFNDLNVHDIMKHRSFVQSVPEDAARQDVVEKFNRTGLKLIAVYRNSTENIVGVIHYKSVLFSQKNMSHGEFYAKNVMKDLVFVPETFTALELLARFRKQRTEFAVVLDEQGSLAGVVTIDDILRVVFGRVTEEKHSLSPESRIKIISPVEFLVPGELTIDDLNDFFKLGLKSDEFMTLGGWLLEKFGFLPNVGEKFISENASYTVEEQAMRRILTVRIRLKNVRNKN